MSALRLNSSTIQGVNSGVYGPKMDYDVTDQKVVLQTSAATRGIEFDVSNTRLSFISSSNRFTILNFTNITSYDIYVAPSGTTSGTGSVLNPFQTITAAIAYAATLTPPAGVPISILLGAGIYTENITINTNRIYLSSLGDGTADAPPQITGTVTVSIASASAIEFGVSNMTIVGSVSISSSGGPPSALFNFEQCSITATTAACITCLDNVLTTHIYTRNTILTQNGSFAVIRMDGSALHTYYSELYTNTTSSIITLSGDSYIDMLSTHLRNNLTSGTFEPIIVFNQNVNVTILSRVLNSSFWYSSSVAGGANKVAIRFTGLADTGTLFVNCFLRNQNSAYALENTGGSIAYITLGNVLAEGVATRTGTFSVTSCTAVT